MSYQVTTLITSDKAVANNESRLSICLRSNGFSFSIVTLDQVLHTFGEVDFDFNRSLGDLTQALKDFFVDQGIQTFGFKEAVLSIRSNEFVWIPENLYDSTRDRQYLKMVSNPDVSLGTYHIYSSHLKSYIVFSAPTTIVTAFKLAIPGIDLHCQHSRFVNIDMLSKSSHHPVILLHVGDRVGDVDAFYGNQLMLSCSVVFANESELLYRTLEIMKQLHMETPDMELAICGNVGRELYSFLQHYFPNVTLYTGRSMTYINSDFQTLPSYKHALLLS